MANKIRVYGKAQNRTALGIANAYLIMHPHATLDELNKAFPISLNSCTRAENIFVDIVEAPKYKSAKTGESQFEMFFFELPDELLTLKNGQQVAMMEMWVKADFEKIIEHAKQFDIEVADYKPTEGYQKGGFTLEYINGYVPPVDQKKKCRWWIWLIAALVVIAGVIAFFCLRQPKPIESQAVEPIVDTTFVQQIATIEKNFNAAQFELGKSDLNEEAIEVLHDLAEVLLVNPELKLRIVGHTSDEGTPEFNRKLSEKRAKAAADLLVSLGVDSARLTTEGMGSSQPLEANNKELNRRTEFEIIE